MTSPNKEYLVQDIIDTRPEDSHFLVRWVGYPRPSWEPLGSLAHCRESLNDYIQLSRSLTPLAKFAKFEDAMNQFSQMVQTEYGQRIFVVNDVDFVAPPLEEVSLKREMVTGKGVLEAKPEFLAGCSRDCQCAGGSENCDCLSDSAYRLHYTEDGRLDDLDNVQAIFECNVNCGCLRERCRNRVVQSMMPPLLAIARHADERGWGIEALCMIPKGTFIDRYYGEIITFSEAEKRIKQGLGSYLFDLDWADDPGDSHSKQPTATKRARYTIDARSRGSISRFLNHSCSPNLKVVPVFLECHDPSMHGVAFFTNRDILEGEALCFDYSGGTDLSMREGKRRACLCGAESCRQYILI